MHVDDFSAVDQIEARKVKAPDFVHQSRDCFKFHDLQAIYIYCV
jgi:hypothetical protein